MRQFRTVILLLLLIGVLSTPTHAVSDRRVLPDGSVVKGSGPRVYVLSNGERRWIQTERDFLGLGYRWSMLKTVSDDDLLLYPRGDAVTRASGYPDHTLLKGSRPEVSIIISGKRRWAKRPAVIVGSNLLMSNILTIADRELANIPEGEPLSNSLPAGPDTTITIAPEHGSTTERTDFTFGFRGVNSLGRPDVTFQTKIEGYDTNWVDNGMSVERRVQLPALPFPYVFFVRSKDRDGSVDRTPAYRVFFIGRSSQVGSVKIDSVSGGTEIPSTEYIILRVQGDYPVDLTGWSIGNDRGDSVALGEVVDEYDASNSFSQRLVVPPQGRVVVNAGRSPVGANIRLNSCAGFLERIGVFTPPIIQACPVSSTVVTQKLSRECQQYLAGLNSCAPPPVASAADINRLKSECLEFANTHWSYSGCKADHRSEPGFFQNEWRVFLGRTSQQFIDNEREVITLRDPSGKIVDQYKY